MTATSLFEKELSIPLRYKLISLFSGVAFIGFSLLGFYCYFQDNQNNFYLFSGLIFCGLGLLCYSNFKSTFSLLQVNDDGITSFLFGKKFYEFAWRDIYEVRDKYWGQFLGLYDNRGKLRIKVHYQLNGYPELRKLIINEILKLQNKLKKDVFTKNPIINRVLFLVPFIFFPTCAWYLVKIHILYLIPLFMISILPFLIIVVFPNQWVFTSDSINFIYPFRQKKINYSEVDEVSIEEFIDHKASMRSYSLVIQLTNFKKITIVQFNKLCISMYFTLTEKLKEYKKKTGKSK